MIYFFIFTEFFFNLLSVFLQLQPRHFLYKRKQKNRKLYSFKINKKLIFGAAGLCLLNPVHLTAKHLSKLKLFLKRASRKSDYTKRFVWIKAFPHLPLTKKPSGTRMGKGKGKLECWHTHVHAGIILFEFKNLRPGRTKYFNTQLTHKLGVKTKLYFSIQSRLPLPLNLSKSVPFQLHW